MSKSESFQFNFPKLRQLAKDIRDATRRERCGAQCVCEQSCPCKQDPCKQERRFNWDDFDLDTFLENCERARQIFEAEERRLE
jgi:hypothetical protein